MPFRHDIRTVTVPGCVDGWVRAPRALRVAAACRRCSSPRSASPRTASPPRPCSSASVGLLDEPRPRAACTSSSSRPRRPGDPVRRPGRRPRPAGGRRVRPRRLLPRRVRRRPARARQRSVHRGRPRRARRRVGRADRGRGVRHDAAHDAAELAGLPPRSAPRRSPISLDLPADPDDPHVAHLLIEAAKAAGRDRPGGPPRPRRRRRRCVAAIVGRAAATIDPRRCVATSPRRTPTATPPTCARSTTQRMGVSLIQSNASGFGSWLVEPNTQHQPPQPRARLLARARPSRRAGAGAAAAAHALARRWRPTPTARSRAVFGTMGGDAPAADPAADRRTGCSAAEQSPAAAIDAGRWVLQGPGDRLRHVDRRRRPARDRRGSRAERHGRTSCPRAATRWRDAPPFDSAFGHAHVIVVEPDGMLAGAADPRSRVGSAAGL